MNETEQIYTIALMQVPGIGVVCGRNLINAMGSADRVFLNRHEILDVLPGMPQRTVDLLDCPQAVIRAEREYEFLRKNNIQCLTIKDEGYPSRLRECHDAPVVLFFRGNANLNAPRVVSVVGTRDATDHGKQGCNHFIREMKELCPDVLVVSGLAYGIDIHAHRAALQYNFSTVGVLAHGLDRIYPLAHRKTAVEMLGKGGLLTEFTTGTGPAAPNFVRRNRIVAGMSDALVVVESAAKGGSLITARYAQDYYRDCFAFPGRYTDTQSQGCNQLIQRNEAALIQSANDLVKAMCWKDDVQPKKPENVQLVLFSNLTEEESRIVTSLSGNESLNINELVVATRIPIHRISSMLFNLEMAGVLKKLAGDRFQLLRK